MVKNRSQDLKSLFILINPEYEKVVSGAPFLRLFYMYVRNVCMCVCMYVIYVFMCLSLEPERLN